MDVIAFSPLIIKGWMRSRKTDSRRRDAKEDAAAIAAVFLCGYACSPRKIDHILIGHHTISQADKHSWGLLFLDISPEYIPGPHEVVAGTENVQELAHLAIRTP